MCGGARGLSAWLRFVPLNVACERDDKIIWTGSFYWRELLFGNSGWSLVFFVSFAIRNYLAILLYDNIVIPRARSCYRHTMVNKKRNTNIGFIIEDYLEQTLNNSYLRRPRRLHGDRIPQEVLGKCLSSVFYGGLIGLYPDISGIVISKMANNREWGFVRLKREGTWRNTRLLSVVN